MWKLKVIRRQLKRCLLISWPSVRDGVSDTKAIMNTFASYCCHLLCEYAQCDVISQNCSYIKHFHFSSNRNIMSDLQSHVQQNIKDKHDSGFY
jgi:hypothetical protein